MKLVPFDGVVLLAPSGELDGHVRSHPVGGGAVTLSDLHQKIRKMARGEEVDRDVERKLSAALDQATKAAEAIRIPHITFEGDS